MYKHLGGISRTVGLPPGTLLHTGTFRSDQVSITAYSFDEKSFTVHPTASPDELPSLSGKAAVTWIDVSGIHQVDIVERLGSLFGIHPLVLEDVLNVSQRPKIEDYGDYLYIVLKTAYFPDPRKEIAFEQVSLIVGKDYLISFQESETGIFAPIRERLKGNQGRTRKLGNDYLAYTLMDTIVDHYFLILEQLGEKIEFLEEAVVTDPSPKTLQEIHSLKNQILFLRKWIWPAREIINTLTRGESTLFKEQTLLYCRDLYDHCIQVIDTLETYREIISEMLDIYLSGISYKLNEVMKVLTIISTIFIPLTFVAGVYGMNFRYMPELEFKWGYPAVLMVMLAAGILMIRYFKKKKWL